MMAQGVAFQPFLYYPQKMSVLFSPPFSFIVGSSPCCGFEPLLWVRALVVGSSPCCGFVLSLWVLALSTDVQKVYNNVLPFQSSTVGI